MIFNWQTRPDASLPAEPGSPQRLEAILARTQLGVVSSRTVGNAVERNRARRLIREVFRLHQSELQHPVRMVLVARASIARRDFAAVERDFLQCLRRSGLTRPPAPSVPATAAAATPVSTSPVGAIGPAAVVAPATALVPPAAI